MTKPRKQHLIDPEICIRCYTCEMTCPIGAIQHDDNNVVVDPAVCNFCMDCIPVCPTGSIDEWRVVETPYSLDEQYAWTELPVQEELPGNEAETSIEALEEDIAALLAEAHSGAGGKAAAPTSAAKPSVNIYTLSKPVTARVQGNYRLTKDPDHDVRHVILDLGAQSFPALEGQSVGVVPPGKSEDGNSYLPRLYSISSPRDGERPNYNNISLTVKREVGGICSNYICDLEQDAEVQLTGPFGATFLMPDDPDTRLLMICTGTGSAPMRAFTMRRQRAVGARSGGMALFFGARSADALPYFGPLSKVPKSLLEQQLVFSRLEDQAKEYVQDRMLTEQEMVADFLADPKTHVYICGLKGMEEGVDEAFATIASAIGHDWQSLRDDLRKQGRYHVETY